MKILLAADGSPYTRPAARHVATHVGQFVDPPEIHVLTVRPPIPYARAGTVAGRAAVQKYQEDESLAALEVAESELKAAGLEYTRAWTVGDVAGEIARYAKEHDIDLVVMGSHGHGALAGLALGSVATKVIAMLEVPVLIVRKAREAATKGAKPAKARAKT